jgi:hypothetical protein
LLQVGIIPAGGEAFVFYTDLQRVVVFQQAQSCSTKDAEVGVSMTATQTRLILLKCYVELPMQAILDRPMTAIAQHGHVLTPGRYVGAEEVEDDDEPFAEKMQRLTATLNEQFAESRKLEKAIRQNLAGLGFGEERT